MKYAFLANVNKDTQKEITITMEIMGIKEYKIIVNPRCKNTLAELSAYVWDKSSPLGNTPRDSDNHLMDAMRYAFFDVKSFRPERVSAESGGVESGISRKDLLGGWSV